MCTAGFGEPLAFSLRARQLLAQRRDEFDVVHDNQCLGNGMLGMVSDGWPLLTTLHHPITVDRQLALSHTTNPWQRFTTRRWFGFLGMQVRVARALPAVVTVSQNSRQDIAAQMEVAPERMTVVPVGVDHTVFRPFDERDPGPGADHGDLEQRRAHEGPGAPARGGGEAAHRARCRADRHRPAQRRTGGSTAPLPGLGLADAVHCVSGISDDELARLYGEAQVAVVPSLYEGFSLPAIEAMSCGVAVVATTGGALPEVVGTDGETGLLVPPDDPGALAGAIARLLDDPALRARLGAPGRRRVDEPLHLAGDGGRHGRLLPGPARGSTPARGAAGRRERRRPRPCPGSGLMLTVDYDRLGVAPGDLVLDLGCGFGRHAFEAARRGASVVALDAGPDEVAQVRGTLARHGGAGRARRRSPRHGGAGRCAGPALRRRDVRPRDRLGGARAHPRRHRRHARTGAGPAPRWRDGGDRAALCPRGDQLGALGRVPRHPGRSRPHLPALDARAPAGLGRARADRVPPCARPPLALLVAALPGGAVQRRRIRRWRRTTRCWSGTSSRHRS